MLFRSQLPVCKVADTRLANVLYNQDVRTVKDLLEIVSEMCIRDRSKLEDPEITVKLAMVVTTYPGASAHQVELDVYKRQLQSYFFCVAGTCKDCYIFWWYTIFFCEVFRYNNVVIGYDSCLLYTSRCV